MFYSTFPLASYLVVRYILSIEVRHLDCKFFLNVLFVCLFDYFKENSSKEWSYNSAIRIETYDGYDPIPVPFNIIYNLAKLLRLVKKKGKTKV